MRLIEAPPAPPRRPGTYQPWQPPMRRHPALRLTSLLIRAGWRWRIELTALLIALTLLGWLALMAGRAAATVLVAGAVGVMAGCQQTRTGLSWIQTRARLRRRWGRACRHAGLETFNERTPRITRITKAPVGEVLRVRLPAGQTSTDLETRAETLAACLQVRQVQVIRDADNARYTEVRLIRRDALAGTICLPWPHLDTARLCLWEPIPVGVNEHANTVSISLVERNLLLGGEPGAGKSVAQSLLIATAALDPDTDLWLLDGKRVELACWRDSARAFVGPNTDDAIDVLRQLQTEMEARYELLLEQRRRKIEPDDGHRLHLVGCDELAFYTSGGQRKAREEFNELCTDLIRRGRAAGIIWIGATQKPSADVVPTSLRDLVGYRWALRCSTRGASDTILGAGMATAGYTASDIAGDQRGVGLLIAENEQPVRLRSFYLSDEHLDTLAERARQLRSSNKARCASAARPSPTSLPGDVGGWGDRALDRRW
jgi:FtsK/SpoIIIE family